MSGLLREELDAVFDVALPAAPYPGLRPFEKCEWPIFFGREKMTDEVVARLISQHFLVVHGDSGCGKSSLVRAGVLPRLEQDNARGGSIWRTVVALPRDAPLRNLADALAVMDGREDDENRITEIRRCLNFGRNAASALAKLLRRREGEQICILVDQFEELFAFARRRGAEEARLYADFLVGLLEQPPAGFYAIITMRSEFLGFCAQFAGLAEAVNRAQYLLPRMSHPDMIRAIRDPARLYGGEVTLEFAERLIADAGGGQDQLPVIQHGLMLLHHRCVAAFESNQQSTAEASIAGQQEPHWKLTLDDYGHKGNLAALLSDHADEVMKQVGVSNGESDRSDRIVEGIFRALTDINAEGQAIRRPQTVAELLSVTGADEAELRRLIDAFRAEGTSFLRPFGAGPIAPTDLIDISHEALIRCWRRIADCKDGWLIREFNNGLVWRSLLVQADIFEQNALNMLSPGTTEERRLWLQRRNPAWTERYGGGWDRVEQLVCASAHEAQREQRRRRLRVGLWGALGVALVALAVLAAFNALSRQKHTMSAELVNRALLDIDRDPAESANLALAAMDQDPANAGAEEALRQALADLEVAHTEAILSLGRPVLDARYSRDGTQLIVASGKTVTLFDARTFEQMGQTYGRNGTVQNAWLIADRKNLITQTDDGQVQMQRIGDSVVRRLSCSGETNRDYSVAVSPDERYVGIGCQDGVVRIWDMAQPDREPQEIGHAGRYTVTALAFSADDEYLASGDASGVVDIWKIGRAGVWIGRGVGGDKAPKIEHDGQNAIREVAFHPSDDNLLVTAGDDNQAIVWQLSLESQRLALDEKKHPKRWVLKHNRPVIHARFVERPDGENPVVTVSGKVVRLWLDEKADISPVRGHDDWVFDANVSSDGEQLVTASNDGTARIWSTRSGAPVAVLRGHRNAVNRAVFSPDGHQVVTASSDGTVRVWRIRPPRLLLYENHWVLSATFEPGGSRIAVGEEGPAVILDPSEGGAAKRDYLTQTEQEDEVFGISWSRDRRLLIGQRGSNHLDRIGNFNPVVIWDVQSKREITPDWLKGYRAATFGPGTDEVLTVNEKGQLAIWKSNGLASGEKPSLEVPEFGDGYASAAMSPDGAWIAATNYSNNNVDLWRREALKEGPQVLAAHRGDVNSLRFSGDSRRLVTASSDRTAIVWSVETSAPVAVLAEGHSGTLEWASFDPSGTRVATASTDGTIHVWDVSQVKTLGVLRWHREAVDQVEFSADGKWILSAGDDGAVNLGQCDECGLSTAELPERVRELAKLPTDQLARINQANDPLRLFDFLKSLLPR